MNELTLFVSTFVLVFALGAQSLNVNNGHYIAAAVTSFVIGSGQMVLFKLAPHASWSEITAFLMGGPFGIMASMWAHPRIVKLARKKNPKLVPTREQIEALKLVDKQIAGKPTRGR